MTLGDGQKILGKFPLIAMSLKYFMDVKGIHRDIITKRQISEGSLDNVVQFFESCKIGRERINYLMEQLKLMDEREMANYRNYREIFCAVVKDCKRLPENLETYFNALEKVRKRDESGVVLLEDFFWEVFEYAGRLPHNKKDYHGVGLLAVA